MPGGCLSRNVRGTAVGRTSKKATLVAVLAFISACSKKREADPAPAAEVPPSISGVEADRGRAACESFRDKICACAEREPSARETCELAKARPEALELALGVAEQNRTTNREDAWATFSNARKIMKGCIEDDFKYTCPPPPGDTP